MLKILRISILLLATVIVVSAARKYCSHLINPVQMAMASTAMIETFPEEVSTPENPGDYFMNDTIYAWDDKAVDWVFVGLVEDVDLTADNQSISSFAEPIEISWTLLNNIKYRLRYFQALEAGLLAPLFTPTLEKLDGKEVTIKGYTIPFEDDYVSLALSANPLSSCFFCGKASPTSIISLQLRNEKRFKTDAIKRFTGRLHLNVDDPNQFYYILSDARPAK